MALTVLVSATTFSHSNIYLQNQKDLVKSECISFLQWALPQLEMQWSGFRKVHKQVCKRIKRRIKSLGLGNVEDYKNYLISHEAEWNLLDEMCRITISRFYRDWDVFDFLTDELLPTLARQASTENRPLRCWTAGCASGEEPYTLALIAYFNLEKQFPDLDFNIVATDIDAHLLHRAKIGCFSLGSLKGLSEEWLNEAFVKKDQQYCILNAIAKNVDWMQQDIRKSQPSGRFDLILCRYLVATYFDSSLQIAVFNRLSNLLRSGGYLILGRKEILPEGLEGFSIVDSKLKIYKKIS